MRNRTSTVLILIALLCASALTFGSSSMAQSDDSDSTPESQTVDFGGEEGGDEATPAPDVESAIFGIVAVGDFPEGYFDDVVVEPGTSVELTAAIVNQGTVPVSLHAFKVNALSAVNGGFLSGDEDDPPTGATAWIDFPPLDVELGPGEQHQVTFTVSVPEGADPGQYIAGLAVQMEPEQLEGSEILSKVRGYVISVGILVPGDLTHAFELGEPVIEESAVHIPVTNTGNYLVRPAGELTLTDSGGNQVHTSMVEMGSVYAGLSTEVSVPLPEQIPPGDYTLDLTLMDKASGASAEISDAEVTVVEPVDPTGVSATSVSVQPNADPIAFANVAITLNNGSQLIPAASVELVVTHDGEELERYPLASNVELPNGETEVSDRYIPANAWEPGTYTFQIVVSAVDRESEGSTVLATIDVDDEIVVP